MKQLNRNVVTEKWNYFLIVQSNVPLQAKVQAFVVQKRNSIHFANWNKSTFKISNPFAI